MQIDFDPAKDASNTAKHGVSLARAGPLEWDTLVSKPDTRRDYDELRMIGYAFVGARLYCVMFADRAGVRRIISLRKAKEARMYSSWRAITWLGRSAALVFLQISRYLLQKPPCSPSRSKRRASTRINPRFPYDREVDCMQKTIKTRSGREVIVPTSKENAAINAGIAADPDTYELGAAEFTRLRRVGRPPVAIKRPMLSMRTDPDVLEKLRASGPGWQTRVNALLREAVEHGRL